MEKGIPLALKRYLWILASEYNLVLVNGSIKDMTERGFMQSDGIHPNQNGHKLIEQEVLLSLSPLLNNIGAD